MADNGVNVVANVITINGQTGLTSWFAQDTVDGLGSQISGIQGSASDDIVKITGNSSVASNANITINTGAGNDTIYGRSSSSSLSIDAGTGNDHIEGSNFGDRILAGAGNDTVYAYAGNDIVDGGDGSDFIASGAGNDIVIGGYGRDYLEGSLGNDTLTGGTIGGGDDNARDNFIYRLNDYDKNAVINFGALWGNDKITDFHAHTWDSNGDLLEMNTLFGRLSDVDVNKIYAAIDKAVTFKDGFFYDANNKAFQGETFDEDGNGNGDGYYSQSKTIGALGVKDVPVGEDIYVMNGLDNGKYQFGVKAIWNETTNKVSLTLTVKNLNNAADKGATITLDNVNDLNASAALVRDTRKLVHGSERNDNVDLTGMDPMTGVWFKDALGATSSFADGTHNGKGVTYLGFAGDDIITGSQSRTGDVLNGGDGSDGIHGMGGNDSISGDNGHDYLWGDNGNDTLYGGSGDDTLFGGTGNDWLYGNSGDNALFGDDGSDVFFINGSGLTYDCKGLAIATLEAGKNTVYDFAYGTDKVRVGDVFADYRISMTDAQTSKYKEWVKGHISISDTNRDGKMDLLIHTSTGDANKAGYNDNVMILNGNDGFNAQQVYDQLNAGVKSTYETLFNFG